MFFAKFMSFIVGKGIQYFLNLTEKIREGINNKFKSFDGHFPLKRYSFFIQNAKVESFKISWIIFMLRDRELPCIIEIKNISIKGFQFETSWRSVMTSLCSTCSKQTAVI